MTTRTKRELVNLVELQRRMAENPEMSDQEFSDSLGLSLRTVAEVRAVARRRQKQEAEERAAKEEEHRKLRDAVDAAIALYGEDATVLRMFHTVPADRRRFEIEYLWVSLGIENVDQLKAVSTGSDAATVDPSDAVTYDAWGMARESRS
jgi:hypothetical protein